LEQLHWRYCSSDRAVTCRSFCFGRPVLLAAIGTYAISLGPVTWVLISEIFPNHVRGAASSIAVLCLWAAYFILTFTFPVLAKWIGMHNTFYLYSGICMLGFLFIKTKVRETKGKTLEELESVFTPH
jgi:SP family xylose:H+ symportor-like MFS transporter